jgi:hypothetical protein
MSKRIFQLRLSGVILLCLIILSWSTTTALAQEPAPSPAESSPGLDPRFGVVDSFVNTTEATAAGVGWTRVFFRWDVIQPAGPSDWKPANVPDTYLEAEIAAGREIVAVLIGTPAWATNDGASTAAPPLEIWGDFVYKITAQYQGRIRHWVIWNLPDISDPASPSYTWAGSEEDYYRLLKEAYQKIKAVDPEMQVHLAGLTYTWDRDRGNAQYLKRLLNIIKADPQAAEENYFFDVVTYHLYYNPRQIFEALAEIRAILDAGGLGHKPIWINETNAPPSDDYLEPQVVPAAVKVTLEEQSNYVVQAFALALAGGAERIAFNKMRNEPAHSGSIEPYGLLRGDNSRRPAFNAFRVVSKHFAGVQQAAWLQLGEIYIVTLDRNGQTTTVLWNMAPTPTTFTLNAIAPQALLVDEQGNEQILAASNGLYVIPLPGAACSNGPESCFIGGPPRLVVEAGSPGQRPALLPVASPTPAPALEPPPPTPTTASVLPPAAPPPTLTPTAIPPDQGVVAQVTVTPSTENITPALALPEPGLGQPEASGNSIPATPEPVPPVSLSTVLRPDRILWLFIIGVFVFTASYGIQVIIWYRLKR